MMKTVENVYKKHRELIHEIELYSNIRNKDTKKWVRGDVLAVRDLHDKLNKLIRRFKPHRVRKIREQADGFCALHGLKTMTARYLKDYIAQGGGPLKIGEIYVSA